MREKRGWDLCVFGSALGEHDARVMPYHVETRFVREEGKRGGLYGAQVGEVEEEEFQRAGGARVRAAD